VIASARTSLAPLLCQVLLLKNLTLFPQDLDPRKLSRAVSLYGKYSTRKRFREMLRDRSCKMSSDMIK
jgi:hypothetical protein